MPTYTAEIAGVPTMVYNARDEGDALAFAADEFILSELRTQLQTPEGAPLWDGQAEVTVRPATPAEMVVWERDLHRDIAEGNYADLEDVLSSNRFVFLVERREVYGRAASARF